MTTGLRVERASYVVGGVPLLRDISTVLTPGRVHVLVGPNGAGKSTLLSVLAGDATPTAGDVLLDGRPLGRYSKKELALRRAVMPQDVVIAMAFTGEEVVMMGRYPHMVGPGRHGRSHGRDHRAVVDEAIRRTEAEDLRERLYPTLSGGEQARVTLARVLAQETDILLLDEPTASLDPRHQHLVLRLARQKAAQGGTVLAVLHDLNLAAAYADDVLLLSDGRLRAQGGPEEVLRPSLLEEVFQTKFHVSSPPDLPHRLVLSLPASD